jgi:hypothetical protein
VPGTVIAVFSLGGCQAYFAREPRAREAVRTFGARPHRLAYVLDEGEQLIVGVGTGASDGWATLQLGKADGGLRGLSTNCGGQPVIHGPADRMFLVPPR